MTSKRPLGVLLVPAFLAVFAGAAWATDTDSDGLSDDFESAYGTKTNDADSDDDGISDAAEITITGTDPNMADTDGDGDDDGVDAAPLDPGTDLDGGTAATFASYPTSPGYALSGETPTDGCGVMVHDGRLTYSLAVAQAKGIRLPFDLQLHYDSSWQYDGYVGKNWSCVLDTTYSVNGSGDLTLRQPPYGAMTWTKSGSTYIPPPGATDKLVGDPTYRIVTPGGFETYLSNGVVDKVQDRFGNTIDYSYNGSGQPTTVSDTRGQTHTFGFWANTGRLKSITMADGRVWYFRYNPKGQLMRIEGPSTTQFPNGIWLEFRYTNGSTNSALNDNMIRAIDGRGQHWMTATYDTSDRVATQNVGTGTFTFSYGNPSTYKTTVTDRNGNDRVWEWDSTTLARKSLVEKTNRNVRSGEGDYTTSWTTDGDGYVTEVIYPLGNGIKTTLNSVKRPTEIRKKTNMSAADSSTNDLITTIAYDSTKFYGVTSRTDPEGHQTTYTLNSKGQATTVTFPTVTHPSPDVTVTNEYSYNSTTGLLESFTDGESNVTSYSYYTSGARVGRVETVTVDSGSGNLNLETTYDYTDWGDVKSVTDPNGNVTTMTVEAYGNVTQVNAPSSIGYITKYNYNGNLGVASKLVKNIDETGSWRSTPQWIGTVYTYSLTDKVTSVSEPERSTTMTYDENDNLLTVTRGDVVVENQYDERDLLYRRIRDPGSSPHLAITEEFTYDGNRNRTSYKNPRNKTTTHTFDLFDRRTKTTNALGHYTEWVYDKDSRITETTRYDATPNPDVLMAHHKTTYDEMDRAWKEEDLLKGTSDTWYARTNDLDGNGRLLALTDRLNRVTSFEYDGAGRRTLVTDAIGNTVANEYDDNGNVVAVTETEKIPGSSSTEAFVTEFDYDALNRKTTQTVIDQTNGSNTHVTSWALDCRNVACTTTDPKGNVVTMTYDLVGRMTQKSEDMGSSAAIVTQWTYDQNDNVTQLNDDKNNDTDYAYDDANRLITKTYENTKTVSYQYDAAGNVTRITDQIGSYLDYGYDDIDQRTGCTITKGTGVQGDTDESWTYDALGRLTQAADNDSIVNFTYDSLSRVLTEEQGSNPLGSTGKTVTYTWNAEGERTKVAYPSGFEARETRDDLGRLTEIKDQSNVSVATFALYGAGGRLKTLGSGNGMAGTWAYDGFRRPTDISNKTSGATERAGFEYGWDANDNLTYEERRHISGKGDVYSYDKANRLTKVLRDVTDPSAEVASPGSYSYDKKLEYDMDDVFNLTAYKVTPYGGSTTTTSYTTNAMNEYTAIGSTSPTYTDNGALKDDGTFKYKYDAHDRLTEVTDQSNVTIATYKYDALGLGRRTKKIVGSATTRYVYAILQSVEELDGSGNLQRLYAFGDRIDQVVMMEAADQADVDNDSNTSETMRFFFHTQLIGSVTHVTAAAQTVVESYEYDPYGKITIKDKTGSTTSSSPIGNAYTYTGRQLDEETGLFYFRARHYSPGLRRFVQRDPLGYHGGPNAASYCQDCPTVLRDPTGLKSVPVPVKGTGGVVTVTVTQGADLDGFVYTGSSDVTDNSTTTQIEGTDKYDDVFIDKTVKPDGTVIEHWKTVHTADFKVHIDISWTDYYTRTNHVRRDIYDTLCFLDDCALFVITLGMPYPPAGPDNSEFRPPPPEDLDGTNVPHRFTLDMVVTLEIPPVVYWDVNGGSPRVPAPGKTSFPPGPGPTTGGGGGGGVSTPSEPRNPNGPNAPWHPSGPVPPDWGEPVPLGGHLPSPGVQVGGGGQAGGGK
jgi:RHS repeat-associated protein